MNGVTSAIAIVLAISLLPAAWATEPTEASQPAEGSGAGAPAAGPMTATDIPTGKSGKPQENEPEWPQPRCEAPAE